MNVYAIVAECGIVIVAHRTPDLARRIAGHAYLVPLNAAMLEGVTADEPPRVIKRYEPIPQEHA